MIEYNELIFEISRQGRMGSSLPESDVESIDLNTKYPKHLIRDVPAELPVGDVIIWRNNDMFRHTATDRDGSFDVDLPPKAEARLVLESAGSIEFYCRLHSGMVGTLTVSP